MRAAYTPYQGDGGLLIQCPHYVAVTYWLCNSWVDPIRVCVLFGDTRCEPGHDEWILYCPCLSLPVCRACVGAPPQGSHGYCRAGETHFLPIHTNSGCGDLGCCPVPRLSCIRGLAVIAAPSKTRALDSAEIHGVLVPTFGAFRHVLEISCSLLLKKKGSPPWARVLLRFSGNELSDAS